MKASIAPHKRPAYGVTQDLTDVPTDAPDDALDKGGCDYLSELKEEHEQAGTTLADEPISFVTTFAEIVKYLPHCEPLHGAFKLVGKHWDQVLPIYYVVNGSKEILRNDPAKAEKLWKEVGDPFGSIFVTVSYNLAYARANDRL
ncbi:hypothetical protein B0H13DRAFT_2349237 [Mycena leptocephala]|nr:hypothetical protein B0H13DRAFT_2349237 [Mycena leptocephala]